MIAALHAFPERPPSEVEWEDLLVRLEIVPRALRLAVEDVGDSPEVRAALAGALARERAVGDTLLPALRAGRPVPDPGHAPAEAGTDAGARAMVEELTRLRERNFAQMQRRGLGVWEWRSEVEGGGGAVTAYQLMQWLARQDGDTLATLRGR